MGSPDKAEGIHRALTTPLESGPGESFRYSDINFILLGALIEHVTGRRQKTFTFSETCLRRLAWKTPATFPRPKHAVHTRRSGAAIAWAPAPQGREPDACPPGTWSAGLLSRIAPTARDEESRADPSKNPDFDHLLRGTVQDTTARRMGGVAGHAGVFSTAHDVSIFAQALLDRLAGRPSEFPLTQATCELMTAPQQPGHTAQQLKQRTMPPEKPSQRDRIQQIRCSLRTIRRSRGKTCAALAGISTRACPRREAGSSPSVASATRVHRNIDLAGPGSDTYIVLLANSIHTRGSPPMSNLRGEVATAAAQALGL